jgi:repressor LexA
MTDEEQRKIFSKNLNFYVANSGKQQKEIAEALGFNQKTFNGWCNGLSIPKTGKIQALADYFGVGKSDLLDDKRSRSTRRGVVIPVLGSVAAGIPIEAIEDVIDTEEITQEMAKTGTFFGLKIKGNSMEPKISDGDIVIVRQQEDAESGDVVIACVNGDEATCKRLRKYKDGIELVSNNPSYEPMFFSNQEIAERPVTILGRVMELRAKF